MEIRKASADNIDIIMQIFEAAKRFMRKMGNNKQWVDGYPSKELILDNIMAGGFYECLSDDREIVGVFYFMIEEDPTYNRIYNGEWLNDRPYGVVHRMASNGKIKGLSDICFQWCFEQCDNIKVDTHRDNAIMQNVLVRNGFERCGIIYLANGAERIAYQKNRSVITNAVKQPRV